MPHIDLLEGPLSHSIIGAFYDVYNALDFGFLEHIYKSALEKELCSRGHRVEREARVVVHYKGEPLAVQILDMIVDEKVIVEAKAAATVHPAWGRQLHNYLRATDLELGLLLHFGLEAKFYRIVELRSRKLRKGNCDTNFTNLPNPTNRSSTVVTPLATSEENGKEL